MTQTCIDDSVVYDTVCCVVLNNGEEDHHPHPQRFMVRILFIKPNMINDHDGVAHPSGRSPVRIGRYLLAPVETKNGKRNKPNVINDWA